MIKIYGEHLDRWTCEQSAKWILAEAQVVCNVSLRKLDKVRHSCCAFGLLFELLRPLKMGNSFHFHFYSFWANTSHDLTQQNDL